MLKDAPPEQLRQAVMQAAAGGTALPTACCGAAHGSDQQPRHPLTPREVQLLDLLATGLFDRTIAKQAFISEATVKIHVSHIYGKFGVDNRTAAFADATQRRIIRPAGSKG